MSKSVTPEQGRIALCGVQGCCPTVDFTEPTTVFIRDDFGGKVQLTREQWQDLKNKFTGKPEQG